MAQLEGLKLLPPTAEAGYLAAAVAMYQGAEVITEKTGECPFAATHLCGHAAEAALKSALSKAGIPEKQLSTKAIGHQIDELWDQAVAVGLPITQPAPDWVGQLSRVHGPPDYVVRYPTKVHAVVLPNQDAMVEGVRNLLTAVEKFSLGT